MSPLSRREFLRASLAAGAIASAGSLSLNAATGKATDIVTLGKSGLKVTRLAFGTGSNNGHVQSSLGQKEFSRLIHYAYDRGIRFFETSESYSTPAMLGTALKDFPRESYQLMNKVTTDEGVDPLKRFDQMRRISQTEYFDIMLLHWQVSGNWTSTTGRWQDGILEAQAEADHPRARRIGSRPARAPPDAGQQVAGSGDDPHESQRHGKWMGPSTTTATPATCRKW